MSREFLSTREVADLLRLKERKVYELARTGAIPVSRATGKLLFPREMVEAWVMRQVDYVGDPEGLVPPPLVLAGSHDPLLDWALRESGAGIASYWDGSSDGLDRMARGEALGAGVHLFENDSPGPPGWNRAHVARAMPGRPVVLIEWARRRQGLVLPPGGAEKIAGLDDLRGARFAPRQPGSGSRLLLDQLLVEAAMEEGDLALLDPPARSQTDVAMAVAEGRAEAGLAVEAAARQLRLDFLPLAEERFDLALWRRDYFEPPLQMLIAFARGSAFAEKAAALGGYDLSGHGRVHYNGG